MEMTDSSDSLAKSFYDFRNSLRSRGIIFSYSGYVTEPVLKGIGEALKQKLVLDEADTKTMRNVFAIFVEQMQNIIRYSAEKEPRSRTPATRTPGSAMASSPSARKTTSSSSPAATRSAWKTSAR